MSTEFPPPAAFVDGSAFPVVPDIETVCVCVASILKPATGLLEELSVMALFPSNSFVNTPLQVPYALKPSPILLTSPTNSGTGVLVVPEPLNV